MYKRIPLILLIPAVMLFASCGNDGDETEPMTEDAEALGTEVTDLTTLADTHHTTVGNAADLNAVTTEEGTYATDALAHHDEMHHLLDDMAACSHQGTPPDLTAFETLVEDFETELDTHGTNMTAAGNLTDAQTEETRHEGVMDQILADMATAHGTIETGAGDYQCPHHGAH